MATVVTGETLSAFNESRMADPFQAAEQEAAKAEEKAKEIKAAEQKEDGEEKEEVTPEKEEAKEEKPKKGKLAERFSEITGKAKAAAARAEAAEAKAAELQARLEALERPAEKKPDPDAGKPKASEYTDMADYAEALADWKVAKAFEKKEAEEKAAREASEREKVTSAWQARLQSARDEIEDFDDMLASSSLAVSDVVRDTIIESEYGPQMLYYLASDEEAAEKLNKMTVKQALMHLAKLEAKFENDAKKEEKAPEKEEKPARAKPPAPITPIKAKSASGDPVKEPGEFTGSYAEWKALRMKQRA